MTIDPRNFRTFSFFFFDFFFNFPFSGLLMNDFIHRNCITFKKDEKKFQGD